MTDETVVRLCAPTLAGMKTGSLFTTRYGCPGELYGEVRRLNRLLYKRGVRVLPLAAGSGRALIYLYRPARLRGDLADGEARDILAPRGYDCDAPERCLARLARRIAAGDGFPHEIGLFLSYPPEDVRGFLRDPARCVFSGCWKVYGDAACAGRLFDSYRRCTREYRRLFELGLSVEQLVK